MVIFSIAVFVIIHFGIVYVYMKLTPSEYRLMEPGCLLFIVYLLLYPVRAITLFFCNGENIHMADTLPALTFTAIYMLCYTLGASAAYGGNQKRVSVVSISSKESKTLENSISIDLLLWLVVVSFLIIIFYYGDYNFLGVKRLKDLYVSSIPNTILRMIWDLRFFALSLSLLFYLKYRHLKYGIIFLVLFFETIISCLISTGKGDMVNLLISYIVCSRIAGLKIKTRRIALFTCFILLFSVYSYYIRFNTGIAEKRSRWNTEESYTQMSAIDWDRVKNQLKTITDAIFSRFNYLDGLTLAMSRDVSVEKTPYVFGSTVELVMFVPRFLFPDRPFYNFSMFTAKAVFKRPFTFLEMPVGRIGEAYLVLGWSGCFMGGFYGWLFTKIFLYFRNKNTLWSMAVYILLLLGFILPDAYLLYKIRNSILELSLLWIWSKLPIERVVNNNRFVYRISHIRQFPTKNLLC